MKHASPLVSYSLKEAISTQDGFTWSTHIKYICPHGLEERSNLGKSKVPANWHYDKASTATRALMELQGWSGTTLMAYHHNIYEERRCQIWCPWSADLDTLVCPLWPSDLALGILILQHTWGRSTRLSREGRRFKKHLLQFMHVCLSNAPKQTNRKLVYIQKRAFWSEEEDGTDYWPALSI